MTERQKRMQFCSSLLTNILCIVIIIILLKDCGPGYTEQVIIPKTPIETIQIDYPFNIIVDLDNDKETSTHSPEPGTFLLIGTGFLLIILGKRFKNKK